MATEFTRTVAALNAATTTKTDDGYAPCSDCRSPTLRSILGQHGARCVRCYEAWCRSGPCGSGESLRALTDDDKVAILRRMHGLVRAMVERNERDPKRWARELRDREKGGEALSGAQQRMWRAALHSELTGGANLSVDAAEKLRTAELQRATQRQVDAYLRANPHLAGVGLSQAERDEKQRELDRIEAYRRYHGVRT